ncbi:Sec7 domain containing protein [Trypanosoma brucei equiperdum]|uniref:Sec7 domain containing protein n=1 Tax=Trypanosoma brucei equiperdum TaxID=630700 RepID=A0A3L6L7Y3_9TRYP|nr:Sec7 domain containing protein [Trypanosoma brucei equiperdum]
MIGSSATTVSCSNDVCSRANERWDEDRLAVATHVQSLLVAIRSNERFGAKARFLGSSDVVEHVLLRRLRALQRKIVTPCLVRPITEEAILLPFCDIWISEEMSYTIIGTAMTSLSNLIDLRCTFITVKGIQRVLELAQRSVGGSEDDLTYEDLLLRKLKLCVSCVKHPCARALPETFFVDVVRLAFVIAMHPDTSLLLRCIAKEAMKDTATAMYGFIIENISSYNLGQGSTDGVENFQAHESCVDFQLTGVPMLRYVCSLIDGTVSEIKEGRFSPGMFGSAADSSLVRKVQLEGLHLAQSILFVVKDHLCMPECGNLLYSVQHNLCRALLVAGVGTEDIGLLSQIFPTVHTVVKVASFHLLPQTYSFLKVLHLDPLVRIGSDLNTNSTSSRVGSVTTSSQRPSPAAQMSVSKMLDLCEKRELILESLVGFCTDANFAVFCYAQYDLSRRFLPLLEHMCSLLVENCFNITNSNVPLEGGKPGHNGLTNDVEVGTPLTRMDVLALEAIKGLLWQVSQVAPPQRFHGDSNMAAMINARITEKNMLVELASLFRTNALKSGIPFLLEKAIRLPAGSLKGVETGSIGCDVPMLILEEPAGGREVGACLYRLSGLLDKRALGDYLGELGREPPEPDPDEGEHYQAALAAWMEDRKDDHLKLGTVRYHQEQLKGFLQSFDFRGKSLLSSIRETAYHMCMPGEAQKIDRVMEVFSRTWLEANRGEGKDINPFQSEQGPFILGFSLIMLNTDQHSGKMSKPMTQEDFRRMHRDSDGGGSLPEEYLRAVFEDVKAHPIIMAEMMDVGFSNDVTWRLEMRPSEAVESRKSDPFTRVSMQAVSPNALESCEVEALRPFILRMIWSYCLTAFGNTLVGCTKSLFATQKDSTQETGAEGGDVIPQLATPEYAYNCALDGLCLLAKAARDRGMASVVDRVILTILSQLPLDLENVGSTIPQLSTQPSALLCLEKVFRVLDECVHDVLDAWEKLGRLFSNFFLLGMFSRDVVDSPETVTLWAELYANPCAGAEEIGDTQPDGGWLSTLWGSPNTQNRTKELRLQREQETMERVKALLPTLEELLNMIDGLDVDSHGRFFSVLCEEVRHKLRQKDGGRLSTHLLVLITEIAVRRPAEQTILDRYIKLCQQTASHYFTAHEHLDDADLYRNNISEDGESSSRLYAPTTERFGVSFGAGASPASFDFFEEWLTSTTRVVKAVLRALVCFASNAESRHVFSPLLDLLMAAPPNVFKVAVAADLSLTLLELTQEAPRLVNPPYNLSLNGVLSALSLSFTTCPSPVVQKRVQSALSFVVREALYDSLSESDDIVNVLVTCALQSSRMQEEYPASADTTWPRTNVKPSDVPEQGELVESFIGSLVTVCHRFAINHALRDAPADNAKGPAVWIIALKGLSNLVVMSRHSRDRNMALLCLQRCLLDLEIGSLSADTVVLVYENVIFPLVEQTCASPSDSPATLGERCDQNDECQGGHATDKVLPQILPKQFSVTSILSSLAPAPPSRRAAQSAAAAAAQRSQGGRDKHREVVDLKCRVVSLLSKVFLHYAKLMGENPVLLRDLWQRVLGTLCALYTSLSEESGTGLPGGEAATLDVPAFNGPRRIGAMAEDNAVLREAIQEAVKNMIYVLASILVGTGSTLEAVEAQQFWTSTKNLLRTFDFAEQLLVFIDNLEGT